MRRRRVRGGGGGAGDAHSASALVGMAGAAVAAARVAHHSVMQRPGGPAACINNPVMLGRSSAPSARGALQPHRAPRPRLHNCRCGSATTADVAGVRAAGVHFAVKHTAWGLRLRAVEAAGGRGDGRAHSPRSGAAVVLSGARSRVRRRGALQATLDRFEHHMPSGLRLHGGGGDGVQTGGLLLGAAGAAVFFAFGNAHRPRVVGARFCCRWCRRVCCSRAVTAHWTLLMLSLQKAKNVAPRRRWSTVRPRAALSVGNRPACARVRAPPLQYRETPTHGSPLGRSEARQEALELKAKFGQEVSAYNCYPQRDRPRPVHAGERPADAPRRAAARRREDGRTSRRAALISRCRRSSPRWPTPTAATRIHQGEATHAYHKGRRGPVLRRSKIGEPKLECSPDRRRHRRRRDVSSTSPWRTSSTRRSARKLYDGHAQSFMMVAIDLKTHCGTSMTAARRRPTARRASRRSVKLARGVQRHRRHRLATSTRRTRCTGACAATSARRTTSSSSKKGEVEDREHRHPPQPSRRRRHPGHAQHGGMLTKELDERSVGHVTAQSVTVNSHLDVMTRSSTSRAPVFGGQLSVAGPGHRRDELQRQDGRLLRATRACSPT